MIKLKQEQVDVKKIGKEDNMIKSARIEESLCCCRKDSVHGDVRQSAGGSPRRKCVGEFFVHCATAWLHSPRNTEECYEVGINVRLSHFRIALAGLELKAGFETTAQYTLKKIVELFFLMRRLLKSLEFSSRASRTSNGSGWKVNQQPPCYSTIC